MVTRTNTNTPPANKLDYQPPTAGAANSDLQTYLDALETRIEAIEAMGLAAVILDYENRIAALELLHA